MHTRRAPPRTRGVPRLSDSNGVERRGAKHRGRARARVCRAGRRHRRVFPTRAGAAERHCEGGARRHGQTPAAAAVGAGCARAELHKARHERGRACGKEGLHPRPTRAGMAAVQRRQRVPYSRLQDVRASGREHGRDEHHPHPRRNRGN